MKKEPELKTEYSYINKLDRNILDTGFKIHINDNLVFSPGFK